MSVLFITRLSTWYWHCWGRGNLNWVGGWVITGVKGLGSPLGIPGYSAKLFGQNTTATARQHQSPTCLLFRLGTGTCSYRQCLGSLLLTLNLGCLRLGVCCLKKKARLSTAILCSGSLDTGRFLG